LEHKKLFGELEPSALALDARQINFYAVTSRVRVVEVLALNAFSLAFFSVV
jgi:hypothetical protein